MWVSWPFFRFNQYMIYWSHLVPRTRFASTHCAMCLISKDYLFVAHLSQKKGWLSPVVLALSLGTAFLLQALSSGNYVQNIWSCPLGSADWAKGDTGPKCAKLSLLESSNKEIGNMDNKLTHVNINLLQIQSVYWPEFFCYQQKDWLFSFIVMNIYYNMDNLENYWES